jgi:hypothetical protein
MKHILGYWDVLILDLETKKLHNIEPGSLFDAATFSKTTLSIITLSRTTINIVIFSIMPLA